MEEEEEESDEEPLPDVTPPGQGAGQGGGGRKRKRNKDGERQSGQWNQGGMAEMKDFLGGILQESFSGMSKMFKENNEIEKARKAEEALERANTKKKKVEDEMLETPAVAVVYEDKNLKDNCRDVVNSDLRAVLVGPFGDPSAWYTGKMTADKPDSIVGDCVDYSYMLGADHVNRRTIRISQSRFKFVELKCWSSENSGIVKDLEILIQHAEVMVSSAWFFPVQVFTFSCVRRRRVGKKASWSGRSGLR